MCVFENKKIQVNGSVRVYKTISGFSRYFEYYDENCEEPHMCSISLVGNMFSQLNEVGTYSATLTLDVDVDKELMVDYGDVRVGTSFRFINYGGEVKKVTGIEYTSMSNRIYFQGGCAPLDAIRAVRLDDAVLEEYGFKFMKNEFMPDGYYAFNAYDRHMNKVSIILTPSDDFMIMKGVVISRDDDRTLDSFDGIKVKFLHKLQNILNDLYG